MIEETLTTFLKSLSTVTAIIGEGNAARIRPDRLDQSETLPAILLEVDEEPQNDLSGVGGLVYADATLTCRAATKTAARALAEAVRLNGTDPGTGLAGYHGTVSSVTFDATLESTVGAFTSKADGSEAGWYDAIATYVVSCAEVT